MRVNIWNKIANELHYFSISFGLWGIYFKKYLPTGIRYIQIAKPFKRNGMTIFGQSFWYSHKNPYKVIE